MDKAVAGVPRWDLSSIFSSFDGNDYKDALIEYTSGMDSLDKRLKDEKGQMNDFCQWLADYLAASNKVGALEESLNAYAYTAYSTDTTNTDYLNNLSKLEEMSLQSKAQGLVFQDILTRNSQDLSTFYTSFPQFAQYKYVLEQIIDGVKNYNIAVKKRGDDITFLRRIVPGGADDSYGIEVAKLAGIPDSVISRAKEILKDLSFENNGFNKKSTAVKSIDIDDDFDQLSLIPSSSNAVCDKLNSIDINTLTPIEAMNLLYELKKLSE